MISKTVSFVSQSTVCIFLEGVDWCRVFLHKDGTLVELAYLAGHGDSSRRVAL